MRQPVWAILLFVLTIAAPGPAATRDGERPDPEMLRMMEFLRQIEMIEQMDMMREMQNVEQLEERPTAPKRSSRARKKEATN